MMIIDDPVTVVVQYDKKNKLLNTGGWKPLKQLARQDQTLTRMVNQAKLGSLRTAPQYKYRFEVTKTY